MKHQLIHLLQQAIQQLQHQNQLPTPLPVEIQIEATRDRQFGDFAGNIAMLLAKPLRQKPRDLAEKIVAALPKDPKIKAVQIAGAGFINFYLTEAAFQAIIGDILQQKEKFGTSQIGANQHINLEYVSSNPTGPLHVGHGRGAAYGATVANLLKAVGYKVHQEYYVNDAGRQMDIITVSIWLRYLQLFQDTIIFPKAGYQGDYVLLIAQQLQAKVEEDFNQDSATLFENLPEDSEENKDSYIDALIVRAKSLLGEKNFQIILQLGLAAIVADMREDLAEFGVHFDEWFYESSLIKNGSLQRCLDYLEQHQYLFKKDNALWFKATQFGDDKDRVVIRENGNPTYFATDMVYHWNKFERNFDRAIDIFGADHHGYIPRIKAFLQALNIPAEKLTILLVQFAILYRGKEKVAMSTRAGEFVTLRELREEVGNDAARFFYIARKSEQHLDFDLELAKAHSNDNPVYYIQYAHARICSVFRQLAAKQLRWDQTAGLQHTDLLTTPHEQQLLRCLAQYPEVIETAATQYEPHLLAHALQVLANALHTYYNAEQFLVADENIRQARLTLIAATRQVLVNGLALLGVSAPEQM